MSKNYYKETNLEGSTYQRAKMIILYNIKGQTPSAEFVEEQVYQFRK